MVNKKLIAGILGLTLGLGIFSTTTAKATIKDSLAKYEKDANAIEHIDLWLNSDVANPSNSHYNAKTVSHIKLIKAYLSTADENEKAKLMSEINAIEKEQDNEKAFYKFFNENKGLTQALTEKCKELGKAGKAEEARLYINKRMDLIKELYSQKDKYSKVELAGEGLNSYWVFSK